MSRSPFLFSVLVAADCNGEKINLRFTFEEIPTLRRLLRDVNEAFTTLYTRQRVHSIFDIGAAVIFNDARCTWDRLEHSCQLYHMAQMYVFQPNLEDSPAEIPDPVESGPFLNGAESYPESPRYTAPAKFAETRKNASPQTRWSAAKMTIQYPNGARVTSKPLPPRYERRQYREYVSGSERFSLTSKERKRLEETTSSTPKRFAVPSSSRAETDSPAPHHPSPRHLREFDTSARQEPAKANRPLSFPEEDPEVQETSRPRRRSASRPRLLSPQRDEDADDSRVEPQPVSSGHRISPAALVSKWERYRRPDSHTLPGSARRPISPSIHATVPHTERVTDAIWPSSSPTPSTARGRISVLSISRDERADNLRQFGRQSPTPRRSSPREERKKFDERMHMPLDELRKHLQLEREEMERSLSAPHGDHGRSALPFE